LKNRTKSAKLKRLCFVGFEPCILKNAIKQSHHNKGEAPMPGRPGQLDVTIRSGDFFTSSPLRFVDDADLPIDLTGRTITGSMVRGGQTIPLTSAIAPDGRSFTLAVGTSGLTLGRYSVDVTMTGFEVEPTTIIQDSWDIAETGQTTGGSSNNEGPSLGITYPLPVGHGFTQWQVLKFLTASTFRLAEISLSMANFGNILVLEAGPDWIRVAAGAGTYAAPNHGLNWTTNAPIYLSNTVPGASTQIAPTISGQIRAMIGYTQGPDLIVIGKQSFEEVA
jgi:hypothetical protein